MSVYSFSLVFVFSLSHALKLTHTHIYIYICSSAPGSSQVLAERSKKYDQAGITGRQSLLTCCLFFYSPYLKHLLGFSGIHRFIPEPIRPFVCCLPPPPVVHHTYHTHHQIQSADVAKGPAVNPPGSAEDVLDAVRLTMGESSTPDEKVSSMVLIHVDIISFR